MNSILDLMRPEHAYIFGFIQTDGHIHEGASNRSSVTIEISDKDDDIVHKIKSMLQLGNISYRHRITNFGACNLVCWRVCNRAFTNELKHLGIPAGKKSGIVDVPKTFFSEPDYYRGLIDGDGSVGVDKNGNPFLGFTTASEKLANKVSNYLLRTVGSVFTPCQSKRDNAFTITVSRENAQRIIGNLYYDGCFGLDRKKERAGQALKWVRSIGLKRVEHRQSWLLTEDKLLFDYPVEEVAHFLNRSVDSVKCRKQRLKV
jgi:hypothetical protein